MAALINDLPIWLQALLLAGSALVGIGAGLLFPLPCGEQRGEGEEGGGVDMLHGSKFWPRKPLNTTQQIRGPL